MNLILFANKFLSYLMLLLIIVGLCGAGVTIGITSRKKKNDSAQAKTE